MNTALWIAQGILASMFGMAGLMKAFRPIESISERMGGWPAEMPGLTRFIGFVEIAGAIALILPIMTDILPWLTPLAAAGLALIQILAIGFHMRRNEMMRTLPINLVLLSLSLFVLIGRFELF